MVSATGTDRGRWWTTACVTLVLLLGWAASAHAGTIQMTSGGLVIDYTGDGNSADIVSVEPDTRTPSGEISRWKVISSGCLPVGGSCLSPQGTGCKEPAPGDPDFGSPFGSVVRCDRTAAGVTVRSGGGDDRVTLVTESDPATVDLGAGDDELSSPWLFIAVASGHWNVTGGDGNDSIAGSSGGNTIDAGPGNDSVRGFPREDGGVMGLPGSKGRIFDRPELSAGDSIFGGPGNDVINAGFGADAVSGGSGNDRFNANDISTAFSDQSDFVSPDAYDGGAGFDTIDYSQRTGALFFNSGSTRSGSVSPAELDRVSLVEHAILGSGNDTALSLLETLPSRMYEGGAGDDTLNGISGSNDTLIGGDGADRMNGFGGNDVIKAKDGTPDRTISCGDGTDSAELDLTDPNPFKPEECESITREAVKEAAVVQITSVRVAGSSLHVHLACPRTNDRACKGRLDAAGRSTRYSIARRRSRTVTLSVGARVAASLRRGARVRLRSVERGRFGQKTVILTTRARH